ncbi:MAG: DUF4249 family protein [Leadbetterella sp.]
MKTKNTILLAHIFVFVSLTSCETLVNEVQPKNLPKPVSEFVMEGYLSPQNEINSITVQKLKSILGETIGSSSSSTTMIPIADAKLQVTDGSKTVDLIYDSTSKSYTFSRDQMPIKSNVKYTIRARESNGQVHEGSTIVPDSTKIDDCIVKPIENLNFNPTYNVNKQYEFQVQYTSLPNSYQRIQLNQTITFEQNQNYQNNEQRYFIYGLQENNTNTEKKTVETLRFLFYTNRLILKTQNYITLLNVDIHYYKYHLGLLKGNGNADFFEEPIPLYSNVSNGYGCIGSFNLTKKEIKIP